MQSYHNIYIIGTSHISSQSIDEIKSAVKSLNPEIIAVELDTHRAHALMSEQKSKFSVYDIKHVGFKGFFFAIIGSWVTKKLGKLVGVDPGSEMKTALLLAKENKIKIALIDQEIEKTLRRFSQALSWKERWHFVADIFNGLILRKKDPLLNLDLSRVPEKQLISKIIEKVRKRYPNIHKVLIEERNYFMARKLKRLMSEHPDKKILAVMGAGHEDAVLEILRESEAITYSFGIGK